MYSFQTATDEFIVDITSVWWSQVPMVRTTMGQRKHTLVSDIRALDEANSPQFWKSSQFRDRNIGEMGAASKVNISDTVAACYELDYSCIGDMAAVTEMEVVKVLS